METAESAVFQAFTNALSGAIGAVTSVTIIYPLDIIRCHIQAKDSNITHGEKKSCSAIEMEEIVFEVQTQPISKVKPRRMSEIESVIKEIYTNEGLSGFYKALYSALIGVFYSEWVYFFAVTFIKYYLYGKREVEPLSNLYSSIIAGLCCVFCTAPYWTAQTQMMLQSKQTSKEKEIIDHNLKEVTNGETEDNEDESEHQSQLRYNNIFHALKCITKKKGIAGLYAGIGPSIILVSNPIIHYVFYEEFVNILKNRQRGQLSSVTYFMCGALAKAIATYATYPLQVMKTQLQKRNSKYECMADYWKFMANNIKKGEIAILYVGLYTKLFQTATNAAIKFMIYEKVLALIARWLNLTI